MKNDAYENSRIKYQLLEKRRKGVKEVIWKLNKPGQKEYIEDVLGMPTEAYLYAVKTRAFYDVRSLDGFLKKLHFSYKKGKKEIVA